MANDRVLVVGTTEDYVEQIRRDYPARALFITDPVERERSHSPIPDESEEIIVPLEQASRVVDQLWRHLRKWNQGLSGVTAFDCESLPLTAHIAQVWQLPYPSPMAVELCRNKLRSKEAWRQAKVPCPSFMPLDQLGDLALLWEWMESPLIMKPHNGTGSELVFCCQGSSECSEAFHIISDHIVRHPNQRLYHSGVKPDSETNAGILMEEFIQGEEYSCDFVIQNKTARIIRVARKFHTPDQPVGTIRAYLVPAEFPQGLSPERMQFILERAAQAVGLDNAVCMVDFIIRGRSPYFLEMSPRPGGDCLPDLIKMASGLDMLGLSLDLAEGRPLKEIPKAAWRPLAGLRLFSNDEGQIIELDCEALRRDERVLQVNIKRSPGDQITLPPADYASRILGHVIFQPESLESIEKECGELESKFVLRLKR
jgi:biotin carboxylase